MWILSIYFLCLLLMGWFAFCRKPLLSDFLVANRQMSAFQIGISMIATCVGGTATIGVAGNVAVKGFPAIWWLLSGALGLLVLAIFLSKAVRQTEAMTLPEIMEKFINQDARKIGAWIIAIAWVAILAAQFSAAARIMTAFGLSFYSALCLACLVITLYTALGGQVSVIKSDLWQYLLVIISFIAVLFYLYSIDHNALSHIQWELSNAQFTPLDIGHYLLFVGFAYVIDPMLFSRILSAKDEKTAVAGSILGAIGIALSGVLIVLVSFAALYFAPQNVPQDAILTTAIMEQLPDFLSIFLLLGLLSAVISSADTVLITAASVFSHDILCSRQLTTYRMMTLLFAVAALFLALRGSTILNYLFAANDIFVAGVVIPLFFALIFKGKINPNLIVLGMIVGSLLGLVSSLGSLLNAGGVFDNKIYSLCGIACSIMLCLLAKWKFQAT